MSYTARTQDAIEYNELSLKYLPGHILNNLIRVNTNEHVCMLGGLYAVGNGESVLWTRGGQQATMIGHLYAYVYI